MNANTDKQLDSAMGKLIRDGMGSLPQENAPPIDLMAEPGDNTAPFQGASPEQVRKALAAQKPQPSQLAQAVSNGLAQQVEAKADAETAPKPKKLKRDLTYFTLLDYTANLFARLKKDASGKRKSTKARVLEEATKRFENLVGRFDGLSRIPSRELETPLSEKEAEMLRARGAVQDEHGKWTVPEGLDLEPFRDWWPLVPEDLRDRTPRFTMTKNGRTIESYVDPNDQAAGSDSTATVLVYGGLAAVASITYLAVSVLGWVGAAAALLAVPFLIALSHGEGHGEAAKSGLLLCALPAALALGQVSGLAGMIPVAGPMLQAVGMGAVVGSVATFFVVFLGSFIITLLLDALDPNRKASVLNIAAEKIKSGVKWGLLYAVFYSLTAKLPGVFQPIFYLAIPALYPMVYANANFTKRGKVLAAQSVQSNIGRMGKLSNEHVDAKHTQAKRAFADKTPLIPIGIAKGYLTSLHYPYAPDEGTVMMLSCQDFSTHVFVWGETGAGKTTSAARPIAYHWWKSNYGGMLVLDGKGALPGDISSLIDIMIEPGVDFAPFQGLDYDGVAISFDSLENGAGGDEGSHGHFKTNGQMLRRWCATVQYALYTHEKNYKCYAAQMASVLELDIDAQLVGIAQAEMLGQDTEELEAKLDKLRESRQAWVKTRDEPRKWFWTPDGLLRMMNLVDQCESDGTTWTANKMLKDAASFLAYSGFPHPEVGTKGVLDSALQYVLVTYPSIAPVTRSGYMTNAQMPLLKLTSAPYLKGEKGIHWKALEEGVDAAACLYGKSVGVSLLKEKHGMAGLLIQALVMQRVFTEVSKRGENPKWREEGQKPLMLMVDECQDLVNETMRDLLPKARSLGLCAVMLTQKFEGIVAKFGDRTKATQFCATFQSQIALETSAMTYEFLSDILGTYPMVTFKQPVVGLDYKGGVEALATSPLNDPNHPNRAAMRKLRRAGAGKLVAQSLRPGLGSNGKWRGQAMTNLEDEFIAKEILVPEGGRLEVRPVFLPEEYRALSTFGNAIVILKRAGVRRVDVAKLFPIEEHELRKKSA